MQRAGLALARMVCAIAPHAQTVWLACGPGNNGGDGLEAAMHLKRWGRNPVVTWLGDAVRSPSDALASLARAHDAGVRFADAPPAQFDVAVDALLGIGGGKRPLQATMQQQLLNMHSSTAPVLCADVPSGLDADTGCYADLEFATNLIAARAYFTGSKLLFCLQFLSIKPGLFTAQGRDAAGVQWWDALGVEQDTTEPQALLLGADCCSTRARIHASHKGSFGDVAVIGGAPGMTGAALLAGQAALHAGAGRVFVGLLDPAVRVDVSQHELMLRSVEALDIKTACVVCGCGGADAVRTVLPRVLSSAPHLVLDADALNAIANDTSLQTLLRQRAKKDWCTVLTPHPLEAARLLACSTQDIQSQRLYAAENLANQYSCTVVLKGSGTIIASPGQVTCINPTGNAKLATAGTGDVLAGMIGAGLASHTLSAHASACAAVWQHGRIADEWPAHVPLTASGLLRQANGHKPA